MKPTALLIVLLGTSVTLPAQTPICGLTLAGFVNVKPLAKSALIVRQSREGTLLRGVILQAGQEEHGVAVLRIHPESGSVEIRDYGEEVDAAKPFPATNLVLHIQGFSSSDSKPVPSILLSEAPLQVVLDLYSQLVDRTSLTHPRIPPTAMSLRLMAANALDVALALDQALAATNVVLIPDGKRLVLAVPKSQVEYVHPHSSEINQTSRWVRDQLVVEVRTVSFHGGDCATVAEIYASLVGRQFHRADWPRSVARRFISFENQTVLSMPELIYALETLLEWHGLKMVADGDKLLKPVWLNPK